MIEMIQKFHRSKFINLVDYLLSKVYFTPKKISKQLLHAKTFASFYYNSMFMYGSAIWSNKILPVTPKAAFFHEQINNTSSQKNQLM
jgi:hypothetical protein